MEEKTNPGKGMAITSLVLGILSIVFLEFIIISVMFGIVAITFSVLSKKKGNKSALCKAGFTLGIISLSVTLALFLFLKVLDVSLFVIPSWYN